MQPYLLVKGTSLKQIQNSYVVVETLKYQFETCLKALDALFKIFFVFNAAFPVQSKHIWTFARTADGQMLPIYVVYKADQMWDMWTTGGPKDAGYNRSKSGWFDTVCFKDWFMSVVVPYFRRKGGPKVILSDNLSSHFSERVLKICEELNISFKCFPPNCTHVMQPLDVSFYAPLKKYCREILLKWKKHKDADIPFCLKTVSARFYWNWKKNAQDNRRSKNIVAELNKTEYIL